MAKLCCNGTEVARIHKPFAEYSVRSNGWILRNMGWGWKRYKKATPLLATTKYASNEAYSIPLSYRWRMSHDVKSAQELYEQFKPIYPKFTMTDAEFWFKIIDDRNTLLKGN